MRPQNLLQTVPIDGVCSCLLRPKFTAAAFAALLASTAVQAVTYTVGTGATYRPFEYEAPNKEIVGFDIDLMKAIAKAQGFDVEFVNTTWSTIFPALNNGDRDIIMSGITITDKRKEAVDFSEPYFLAHQLILTSSNLQIKSLKDLEGKLIAVVNASAGDVAARTPSARHRPTSAVLTTRRSRLKSSPTAASTP